MRTTIFILILFAVTISCDEGDSPAFKYHASTNMLVNYYTKECQGMYTMQCLQIQEGDDIGTKKWMHFYDNIEGFTYEPGTRYALRVRKEQIPNPPIDGSSIRYILVEILNSEKVLP